MLKIQIGLRLALDSYGRQEYAPVIDEVFRLNGLAEIGKLNQFGSWHDMVWTLSKDEQKQMKADAKHHNSDDLKSRIRVYNKLYSRIFKDRIYYILKLIDSGQSKTITYNNPAWKSFITYICDTDDMWTQAARR